MLPMQLGYILTAYLVTVPGTRLLRIAMFPLWVCCAYRMATKLTLGPGQDLGLMTMTSTIIMRIATWTFESTVYVRTGKNRKLNEPRTLSAALWDTGDLCFNFRGIGWNWGHGIHVPPSQIPKNTPPDQKRRAFLYIALRDWLLNGLALEALIVLKDLLFTLNRADPLTLAYTLPPALRRLLESLVYPLQTYFNLSAWSKWCALFGVFVVRQDPDEWPPFFDSPLRATSLSELWGKRWHLGLQQFLCGTGGRLFNVLFGRVGYIMGTFIMSGLFHDAGLLGLAREDGFCHGCNLTLFFVMNGVGIVLEGLFRRVTGKRVGGLNGTVWLFLWALFWFQYSMSTECLKMLYFVTKYNWAVMPVLQVAYILKWVGLVPTFLVSYANTLDDLEGFKWRR
ncbi:hypothetical protein CYLTODRAFT_340844 [Cylindrobasidium torrendii FP15055 ss-10]|uniref:Wax synthase domain-containing protein n=1 Tax=Cylindrobasidium torrendii FP15055 ss-10 TaxID=1314674 RepID=A0A0D7BX16_9AGAR|nr:hypothetical protein CYLTODRAFT_340844 [Cylindrobasidium torrendii FP15055 ss-10]